MSSNMSRDLALLLGAAAGGKLRDIAAAAHVSPKTVSRRLRDPEFAAEVAELRAELVAEALNQVAGAMSAAVATLTELLASPNEWIRLAAARDILNLGLRATGELPAPAPEQVPVPTVYQLTTPDNGRQRTPVAPLTTETES